MKKLIQERIYCYLEYKISIEFTNYHCNICLTSFYLFSFFNLLFSISYIKTRYKMYKARRKKRSRE